MESEYLEFQLTPKRKDRKTDIWFVISKSGQYILGTIEWYSPWRQFTFQPRVDTIWNRKCLEDINKFITIQMDARRG